MKKDKKLSLRVSGVVLEFIKGKLGIESDYESVERVLRMYWDAYHPLENVFVSDCVPENGVAGQTKVASDVKVIEKKEITSEDGIISDIVKGKVVKYKVDDKGIRRRV